MMTAEIKFVCHQCGQPIVTDAAAAGLNAECPTCLGAIVIPAAIHHRDYGSALRRRRDPLLEQGNQRPSVEADLLREELVEAGERQAELESALAAAQAKLAKVSEQLEAATAEGEQLHSTYQAERNTFEAELAQARRRLAAADDQLASGERERAAMEALARKIEADRANLENDLSIAKQRADAAATQLAVKERELAALRSEMEQALSDYSFAQAEAENLQRAGDILGRDLESAHARLTVAGETAERLAKSEAELAEARRQLHSAEEGCKSLAICCEELKKETVSLRRDLTETKKGREIFQLRAKVTEMESECERLLSAVRRGEEELRKSEAKRTESEQTIKGLHQRLEVAEKRAEETSAARVKADNDVLRGIVTRQNSELESWHAEVARYKQAKVGLRLAYVLFSATVVALGIVAILKLPELFN